MQCHSCGADVRVGQKFCMECGASLRGVADDTGEVPLVRRAGGELDERRHDHPNVRPTEDATAPLRITPTETFDLTPTSNPALQGRPTRETDLAGLATAPLPVVGAPPPPPPPSASPTARRDITGQLPTTAAPAYVDDGRYDVERDRPGFRLRPMFVLALLAVGATVVGVLATMITITPSAANPPFEIGDWKVNDFGTNNAVAGLLAAGAMVLGALVWCFGARWGAGLAGGAGAALAGWVALVIGLSEWPIESARRGAAVATADITRDVGYWSLVGAGGLGLLVLAVSLRWAGRDGHAGLDPWVAALAAAAFVIAAGGPLIPQGSADITGNYSSESIGVDLPTLFFVGRAVQLALLAAVGIVGMLTVRRYGLGLAVGGAIAAAWLVGTAATDKTTDPIGLAHANPGSLDDLQPHAVTVVGMACVGFFLLVAIVMALLDSNR